MRTFALPLLMLIFALQTACKDGKNTNDIICTQEFVVIGVKIIGSQPDSFYTVRLANSDTIRFQGNFPVGNWYPVLDDSFQPLLEDKREDFHFIALKNGEVVINELYEIGADKCHIIRYTGPSEISLD